MDARPLAQDPIAQACDLWRQHGWADAAEGMAAVTSVMRAQQILLARCEAVLRPLGLTFARYEVLMLLGFSRRGGLPMRVLGSRLQVHPTSVTNAVERLARAGLVTRQRSPADARAVLVSPTEAGQALAARATEQLNSAVFARPGLDADEVRELIAVLARLRAGAGDFTVDGHGPGHRSTSSVTAPDQ